MPPKSTFPLRPAVPFLAVGCVIASVATVLFPLSFRARDSDSPKAKRICQDNLEEVMLAVVQYAHDYDGHFAICSNPNRSRTDPPSSGYVNALHPYVRSFQAFQCPGEPNGQLGWTDYACNRAVGGLRAFELPNIANTVVLCEANEARGAMATASAPLVTDRHQGGSDYAFVDGHVKWFPSAKAPSASNVPANRMNFTFGS